jgi:(p)ppGpp synthase/HD superfamily hydrolase
MRGTPPPEGKRDEVGLSENPILFLARALDFAARKHVHQRRKGALAEPYINHLADVAHRLALATDGGDLELVVAGLLHDTLEDTETTYAELVAEFGRPIADLVAEVSDDTSLPKAERRRLQIATAATKSLRARMLKLADMTSNLSSFRFSPPKGWPLARQREYFAWAKQVAAACRGVNPQLEADFDRTHRQGLQHLEQIRAP